MEKLIKVRSHVERWWLEQMGKIDDDCIHDLIIRSEIWLTFNRPCYSFTVFFQNREKPDSSHYLLTITVGIDDKFKWAMDQVKFQLRSFAPFMKQGQTIDPLPEMEAQDV